ncbi:MAG: hypothetical protein ACE14Q_05985 [Acidobacteriota bacterium]
MKPEYIVILAIALVALGILAAILSYIQERKRDALRKEKAMIKGWNYESPSSASVAFKVEGTYGDMIWKLEQRSGKDNNRPLIFTSKSISLSDGVFYFADKRETDILLKPFMQYILKLGTAMSPKDSNYQRTETISLLQDAIPLEIQSGGRWNYGALSTSPELGYKILSLGFQAEIDSLSLIDSSPIPPSVILSPDGLEIKWQARKVDAEKMEMIIESSIRVMNILSKSLKSH